MRVKRRLTPAGVTLRRQFSKRNAAGSRNGRTRATCARNCATGVGIKSQASILAYESARLAALAFAGRGPDSGDVAIICRNRTEAINHLACRLELSPGDVVLCAPRS